MLNTKTRMALASLVLSIFVSFPFVFSSCLTAEQQVVVSEMQTTISTASKQVAEIIPQIVAIRQAVIDGKMPVAEGQALVEKLISQQKKWVALSTKAQANIKKAEAMGLPWWAYAVSGLSGVATIVGAVLGIPIVGKLGQATAAVGMLSRSADATGLAGEATPAFKTAIEDELKADDAEISAEVLKALHAQARAGTI